ncbi:hypothetical protein SAMN05421741_12626 [Paenimyroides ummariense]|uniref:Uncharacterized protein n=2 Tax=Paenimyroides ummariense TaxID=913024 RepID=A0A1I5FAQ8_9FLAO|nr:hypothetical protein SAMN05421741_12626 [Paenimyroides ummariense]
MILIKKLFRYFSRKIYVMKNILILVLFCLGFNFKSFSQDLSNYNSFIKDNFPEYFEHFKITDFKNFKVENTNTFNLTDDVEVFKLNEWSDFLATDNEFFIYNSTKSYAVNFNTYGDIDQAVLLIDVKNKQYHKLTFCGSPCRYEEAKWVNDAVVILVGGFEDNDKYNAVTKQSKYFGMLMVVDLDKKTRTIYFNKLDEADTFFSGKLFKNRIWD